MADDRAPDPNARATATAEAPSPEGGEDLDALMGPLRLALFTPVREYPPMGDRKAVAILGTNGLMLSVVLFFSGAIDAILESGNPFGKVVVLGSLGPFAAAALVGTWAAFRALTMPIPAMPESLAFFPDIARLDRAAYLDRVKAVGYRDALRDMLHYNYSLAALSAAKFRLINRAIICSKTMFPLWVAVLLALTALRPGPAP